MARFIACYLTTPHGAGALLPVDNREQWVFHAPWHPDRGETLEDFTDEEWAALLTRVIAGLAPATPNPQTGSAQ